MSPAPAQHCRRRPLLSRGRARRSLVPLAAPRRLRSAHKTVSGRARASARCGCGARGLGRRRPCGPASLALLVAGSKPGTLRALTEGGVLGGAVHGARGAGFLVSRLPLPPSKYAGGCRLPRSGVAPAPARRHSFGCLGRPGAAPAPRAVTPACACGSEGLGRGPAAGAAARRRTAPSCQLSPRSPVRPARPAGVLCATLPGPAPDARARAPARALGVQRARPCLLRVA